MANIVPQVRTPHELGRMAAPAAGRGTSDFYQREKKGAVCDFIVTDGGKVFRVAQYMTDGCLHLRPGNAGSGLDVDANGYVKVIYDRVEAARPQAQENPDFEDEDDEPYVKFGKLLAAFSEQLKDLADEIG